MLLESGIEKVLIFAHHKCLLNAIEKAVRDAKADHIRIDGDVLPKKRAALVDKFQLEAACRVAVLGIKAAGTGLTLTAASTVVRAL
jgi:SWI/SNF-related matrix-associated actin-dependent regulator of chromatin subfamily A-like protein 1